VFGSLTRIDEVTRYGRDQLEAVLAQLRLDLVDVRRLPV
jgi:hypothetical protein